MCYFVAKTAAAHATEYTTIRTRIRKRTVYLLKIINMNKLFNRLRILLAFACANEVGFGENKTTGHARHKTHNYILSLGKRGMQ